MALNNTYRWQGHSGHTYEYLIAHLTESYPDIPGNYIFAERTGADWRAIYIGETESLKTRLIQSHEKWDCARLRGATHIHIRTNHDDSARLEEERDLIAQHGQIC